MNKDSQSAPGGAEVTHTPGPWHLEGPTNRTVVALDGLPLMSINRPPLERDANARLIAAAPDLLEALRFVLLRFPCLEDKHLPYLRGIVAKATEEVQT